MGPGGANLPQAAAGFKDKAEEKVKAGRQPHTCPQLTLEFSV